MLPKARGGEDAVASWRSAIPAVTVNKHAIQIKH